MVNNTGNAEYVREKTAPVKAPPAAIAPVLSVIVPTRNEAPNIQELLTRIGFALESLPVEVIFIDDSSDDTPQVIRRCYCVFPQLNIYLIHRPPAERSGGLGGAVVRGILAARSEWVCVMDGDLQHPPELIPELLRLAVDNQLDLVSASRREAESKLEGFGFIRDFGSKCLDKFAHLLFHKQLKATRDPLTGFFLLNRKSIDPSRLNPNGFKILLEILIKHPDLRKGELPFQFGQRFGGKSKASVKEVFRYLSLLISLRFGPGALRFISFGTIGLSGIFVNSFALFMFTQFSGIHYLLSAGLATLFSTTWNFSLTDWLVYKTRSDRISRARRLIMFFSINHIALLFRVPIMYGLSDLLGIHYLASNLISLFLLTLGRFLVADGWIWRGDNKSSLEAEPTIPAMDQVEIPEKRRHMMNGIFTYHLHDILWIQSEVILPELEPFRIEGGCVSPDIDVKIGKPHPNSYFTNGSQNGSRHLLYKEIFGYFGFEADISISEKIEIIASPLLRRSPHVLYTNVVEPILRWTLVERGYALVHGATIAYNDRAYLITARTDTGKTTTLLQILKHQRRKNDKMAFISDDMTLITANGDVITYPKPLTISFHTLKSVEKKTLTRGERFALVFQSRVHSRSSRFIANFLGKTKMPMATVNAIVQLLIPPPKYPIERLIPTVKFAPPSHLVGMFVIERGGNETSSQLGEEESLEILMENCEDAYGFPPYCSIMEFLYNSHKTDLRLKEKQIIQSALRHILVYKIQSNMYNWWRTIPTIMDEDLEGVFIQKPIEGTSILDPRSVRV